MGIVCHAAFAAEILASMNFEELQELQVRGANLGIICHAAFAAEMYAPCGAGYKKGREAMILTKQKTWKGGGLRRSKTGDKVFYAVNFLILGLLALIVLYPLYFIIIASISDPDAVLAGKVVLAPVDITFSGFAKIIERTDVWRGYLNTIIYTLITIVLSLAVTIPAGWALSRKTLPGKKLWMVYFIIPMFFGGGLIPFYNVMSGLHMVNTIWAIILPAILSVWNLFMTKTFFESSIPEGLLEAAKIDGAGHFRVFVLIVLPLAKAIMAVMALYYAVGQWNSYFNAMIFLQDEELYPLQLVLKEILVASESTVGGSGETILEQYRLANQLKYVSVIVSSLPVLMLFPFVQKYFAQGVMIGSLKE